MMSSLTSAVTSTLNYIDGRRMPSKNNNVDDDVSVLEPATGMSSLPDDYLNKRAT